MSSSIINTEIDSLITFLSSDDIIYLNDYTLLIKLHLNKYFKDWLNDKYIYPKYKIYHSSHNKFYNNQFRPDGEKIPYPNITMCMIPNNINTINFVCCQTNTLTLKDIYFNPDMSSGFFINGSFFMLDHHVENKKYGIANIDSINKPIGYYKYNTTELGVPKLDSNEIGLLEPFDSPSLTGSLLKHTLNWANETLGVLTINDKNISIRSKDDFFRNKPINPNAQFLTGNLLINRNEIVMKEELILIVYNLHPINSNGIDLVQFTKCILCSATGTALTIEQILQLTLNAAIFLKNDSNQIFNSIYNTENLFFPYNASLYNLEFHGNFAGVIPPGMPTHASDLNPRTCIFIDSNEHVFFMNVEGRETELGGVGLDLFQLALICKSMGAVYAINLDGGGSSVMGWKEYGNLYDSVGIKDYTLGNAIVVLPDLSS